MSNMRSTVEIFAQNFVLDLFPKKTNRVAPDSTHSSFQFPTAGINLDGLDVFIASCGGKEKLVSLSTGEVCEQFLLPLTRDQGCSYTHLLSLSHPEAVSKANVFISHAWKFLFLDVVDSLQQHFKGDSSVFLWFDLFSNNQHLAPDLPFEWWCGTFQSAIKDIGYTVLVLEPWHNPIPFTRAWCLWEIYCAVETESRFEVCISLNASAEFLESILNDSTVFFGMLSKIDVRNSESTCIEDKKRIFEVVKATAGFEKVNSIILERMRQWVLRVVSDSIAIDSDTNSVIHKKLALASLLRSQGRFDEARVYNEECLEISLKLHGTHHPTSLKAENNLGMLLKVMGRNEEALPLYESCLARRREVLGENHEDTLHTMNNLGILYKAIGRRDEAQELLECCLSSRRDFLGATHPSTLASLNNLANLYKVTGRVQEAIELYRECLEERKRSLGTSHPDTLTSMNNLAVALRALERDEEAVSLYEACWEIRREKLGSNHPESLVSMSNLCRVYLSVGRTEVARETAENCWALRIEALGSNHPATLTSMDIFSGCLQACGEHEKALDILDKCIQMRSQRLGEFHHDTLSSLHNKAMMLKDQDRDDEALAVLSLCLERREEKFGVNHQHTITARAHMGLQLGKLGRHSEAVETLSLCLEARTELLGGDHPETLTAMSNLACALLDIKEVERAQQLYEHCLQARRVSVGPHHISCRLALYGLAQAYNDANRGDEAIEMLEKYISATECDLKDVAGSKVDSKDTEANMYGESRSTIGPTELCILETKTAIASLLFKQGIKNEAELLYQRSIRRLIELEGANSSVVKREIKSYNKITGQDFVLDT